MGLNIPIARVPRLTTFALTCVVISPQKCFGRRLSPSPGVGFYILSDLVILSYSFVKMDLLFYLTMEKSRPIGTGLSTQFSDKIIDFDITKIKLTFDRGSASTTANTARINSL